MFKEISLTKKGLLFGLVIGLLFGIHMNLTSCHTSPGGPSGCSNNLEIYLAAFEFFLQISLMVLLFWIPNFSNLIWKPGIVLFISPIILFGLISLFIGWVLEKITKKNL